MDQRAPSGAPAMHSPQPSASRLCAPWRGAVARLWRWFAAGDGWLVLALIALPIIIRLPEWLGLAHANALGYTAGLGSFSAGYTPGQPTIDPNIGFTSQALGTQAARQWFAGRIPWWNPYEGVGMPLAGEMQSAAFFPLTLLLIAPQGQTIFHVCLQIIAGVSTYYLLRQMRLSRLAALTGGALFEFNGVFAWLANAVVNPIPFLPLLLLGVERALAHAQSAPAANHNATLRATLTARLADLARGWKWIAVALALALVAGFPEVAYIDGVFAALWVAARLLTPSVWAGGWRARLRFARGLALGVVVGVALAAPPLVAFADFLPAANVSEHAQGIGAAAIGLVALAQYVHPYVFGAIFQFSGAGPLGAALSNSWGNIGGYLGATTAFLALLGVFGRRNLPLRVALAGWIVSMVGRSVGAQPFTALVNHLPLMNSVAVYRYANASWVMAAITLASFALDDWRGARGGKLKALLCAAFTLCVISLGSLRLADAQLHIGLRQLISLTPQARASIAIEWGAILVLLVALLCGRDHPLSAAPGGARRVWRTLRQRPHAALMGLLAVALSLGYFTYPTLANPRAVTVDMAAVRYLQAHSGYSRFVTLGPFAPNYGSYFDVASVNYNDLPVSQRFANYVLARLDPYANPTDFLNFPRDPALPSYADELATRLAAYEAVGVKYVITSPGQQPFAALPVATRPTLVYHDAVLWIYQTPTTAPLFSASGCRAQIASWTQAQTTCAAPATLTYRSLSDPGWRATVNGQPARITPAPSGALFQQIALPAGQAQVSFSYMPPHAPLALIIAGLALLTLLAALVVSLGTPSADARPLALLAEERPPARLA